MPITTASSLTLAQLDQFFTKVAPLPEAPLLDRLLFEQPLMLGAGLLLAGLVAVVALRNANKMKAGILALGVAVVLTAGVFATASMVTTDREALLELQDDLVRAVAEADIDALDQLLARDARMPSVSISLLSGGLSRERILSVVASTTGGAYPVSDHAILDRQAVVDGPNAARTQVHARVESGGGAPTLTWFRIAWRLDPEAGWQAVEIEPLFISGVLPYKG